MADETVPAPVVTPPVVTPPTPPLSPTGTPIIPPKAFGWITLGVSLGLAVLGALALALPEYRWPGIALGVLSAVAGVLGMASPGLRKSAPVLLVALALGLSGCAWWQRVEPQLADCGRAEVGPVLSDVVQEVGVALNTPGTDWQAALASIAVKRGFDALACALQVVVSSLETGPGGCGVGGELTPPGLLPASVRLLRAYSYLDAHPVQYRQPAPPRAWSP